MTYILKFFISETNWKRNMPSYKTKIQGTKEYAIAMAKSIMKSNKNFKYYEIG